MQKLSGKNLALVGFTLFSMFFGAGNLIFPPHLGAQAGSSFLPAFLGLAISAVGLPVAGIFIIACFNTCVGLIACVGQYFHGLLPGLSYPVLAAFFAAASMLISNLGLAGIIRLSTPVLGALYPVAILLILLSFVPGLEKRRGIYPLCIGFAAVQSIAAAGFGWVLPALAGLALAFAAGGADPLRHG